MPELIAFCEGSSLLSNCAGLRDGGGEAANQLTDNRLAPGPAAEVSLQEINLNAKQPALQEGGGSQFLLTNCPGIRPTRPKRPLRAPGAKSTGFALTVAEGQEGACRPGHPPGRARSRIAHLWPRAGPAPPTTRPLVPSQVPSPRAQNSSTPESPPKKQASGPWPPHAHLSPRPRCVHGRS